MLQLDMPRINVLFNIDLLSQYEELGESSSSSDRKLTLTTLVQPIDFNPDFYTEVQDLTYLETTLNASLPSRYAVLNMVMISLVEDFISVDLRRSLWRTRIRCSTSRVSSAEPTATSSSDHRMPTCPRNNR
jgi:hypothetical protein